MTKRSRLAMEQCVDLLARVSGEVEHEDQDPYLQRLDVGVQRLRRRDRQRFGRNVLVDGLCATEALYSSSATGEEPGLVALKLMAAAMEGLGTDPRLALNKFAPSQISGVFRQIGATYIVTYWIERAKERGGQADGQ